MAFPDSIYRIVQAKRAEAPDARAIYTYLVPAEWKIEVGDILYPSLSDRKMRVTGRGRLTAQTFRLADRFEKAPKVQQVVVEPGIEHVELKLPGGATFDVYPEDTRGSRRLRKPGCDPCR